MTLIFTRRTLNPSSGKFTDNFSTVTRYVRLGATSGGVVPGNVIDAGDWVDEALSRAGSRDVVFWVHGFNTSQTRMIRRQRQLERDLRTAGFQGVVVGFDWPSDGSVLRYRADRSDAKRSANALVTDGLALFMNKSPAVRIHILAHSMGAYLTLRGFAGVGDAPGSTPWAVDQVLFGAADTDRDFLQSGAWGALVMERRATRLTNYYNTNDAVLEVSGVIPNIGRARAGRNGIPPQGPANAVDLRMTERFKAAVPEDERDVNTTHNWYFEDPKFLADAAATLAGAADSGMAGRGNVSNGDRFLRP